MYEDSGIYSPGPIKPVAEINETLGIFTKKEWVFVRVKSIEGMPYGTPMVIDFVARAGATVLAAGATTAKLLAPLLQINEGELLHLRFKPLDNVEGQLFEVAADGRWTTRSVTARITQESGLHDPYWAASTFWIYGFNRDPNFQVVNNTGYGIPQARFVFWGWRYTVETKEPDFSRLTTVGRTQDTLAIDRANRLLRAGDPAAIKAYIGPATLIPAEGSGV